MGRKIVNIRYRCCGLSFDAAVDCDYQLHDYDDDERKTIPIELYCFNKPEWDVRVIFQDGRNDSHTEVNWPHIINETRKWVREMRKWKED